MNSDYLNLDPDFLDETSKNNIEDYICCICQLIPNPETCLEEENCGHLFCKCCLDGWLKKSQNCPFCKNIISKRSVKDKNKIIFRHLINLIVLCQQENCNWKGIWKDYLDHLKKNHKIKLESNTNFELYKYYKSTVHEHPLKFLDTTIDNGWACDGRNLSSKCFNGITGFNQTKGLKRFRCMQCDYDLCEFCMKNYYDINYLINNDNSDNRGLYIFKRYYYVDVHNHPLNFLDKSKDNGWVCNGIKLEKKCFSGITDLNQTKNIPRFRCNKCDFDLCENCVNNYKKKINFEFKKSYKVKCHNHPLLFLDKSKDNGWACDGRKLEKKCFSGITGFNQTKNIPRFRCDKCDFDLCENCMEYYYFNTQENNHSKEKNCLIF